MEQIYRERLAELDRPWCSASFIAVLLGIDLTGDSSLVGAFRSWAASFMGLNEVERSRAQGLEVHRHALETYLAQNRLVSWKWAGIYVGLTGDDFKAVVERLKGSGVAPLIDSGVSDQLVRQREAAQLHKAFPSIRRRTFSDHSRMCRVLHETIRAELAMTIEPLICVTSQILDAEPDIAAAFDAITLDPVGLRYQVWLDTKKPVNLRPDVCSLRFYAQNENELRDRVMKGSEPEAVDNRLRA